MFSDHVNQVGRLTRIAGHPLRTALVRLGIGLALVSGVYLVLGIAGFVPLPIETLAWNNIRIVAGLTIAGCLMAAIGYRNR
jgi:hypothetical protein